MYKNFPLSEVFGKDVYMISMCEAHSSYEGFTGFLLFRRDILSSQDSRFGYPFYMCQFHHKDEQINTHIFSNTRSKLKFTEKIMIYRNN